MTKNNSQTSRPAGAAAAPTKNTDKMKIGIVPFVIIVLAISALTYYLIRGMEDEVGVVTTDMTESDLPLGATLGEM